MSMAGNDTVSRKLLDYEPPMISAWSYQSALMSILQTDERFLPWVYSNYIQTFTLKDLYHSKRPYTLDFFSGVYGDWQYLEHKTNPWITYYKVPRNFVFEKWDSVSCFIMDQIDSGMYCYFPMDVTYIKNHNWNFYHTPLFYGYDREEKYFNIADNLAAGRFSTSVAGFDEVEQAAHSSENRTELTHRSDDYDVVLFKRDGDKFFDDNSYLLDLNIPKIKNDIKEYLLMPGYGEAYRESRLYAFGTDCYDALTEYFSECFNNRSWIDIRALSCFIDHKSVMANRIEYLIGKGMLSDRKYLDESIFVRDRLAKVRAVLIKERIRKRYEQMRLVQVINELKMVKGAEIQMLSGLLGIL